MKLADFPSSLCLLVLLLHLKGFAPRGVEASRCRRLGIEILYGRILASKVGKDESQI